jgi:uncharacterized Zn finger protein (UPF0148 family)
MKQIVCEMCGGKDLIKQDGMFTCQNCGTKYSVEEAKKMMVTIDNSAKLENALKNARRAMEEKNYEKAKEYYNIAQMEDPENWEANFYSQYPYYSLKERSITKNILKDIKKLEDNGLQNKAIEQISTNLINLLDDLYIKSTEDFYKSLELKDLYTEILKIFVEELVSEFGENEFTISIKIQCDKILLKIEIQSLEFWLKSENNSINRGYCNWKSAELYANKLAKINPASYELARYNKKKYLKKYQILIRFMRNNPGLTILLILIILMWLIVIILEIVERIKV